MEIRDPIHGFIDFNDTEREIINHPAFQRLRRIRQLAMSDLAYPGAVHHRFEHSLGVCHIAGRIAKSIFGDNNDKIRNIRLAALIHDIGHGPFSHVSEAPFAKVNRDWLEENKIKQSKIHECIGADIVRREILEDQKITASEANKIVDIIDTVSNSVRSAERDIVSGPLDADKMDYLLRDSYYAGVQYGVFDLERLVRALVLMETSDSRFLGVEIEDIPVVDQYVMARYDMHLQVYGHKTRRATDLMLERSIMKAIESNDKRIVNAYTYKPDSKEFTQAYLGFDDRSLLHFLSQSESKSARKLSESLRNRLLPSRILYEPLGRLADRNLKEKLQDENKRTSAIEELEQNVICCLGDFFDKDYIFVSISDAKEVGGFNTLSMFDPDQIHVRPNDKTKFSTLAQESNFFRDYEFTPRAHIAIYARLETGLSPSKKQNRKQALDLLSKIISFTEDITTEQEDKSD